MTGDAARAAERLGDRPIQAFLGGREIVVLATVQADGSPLAIPMWFVHDAEALGMISLADTQKVRNVRRDARVAVAAEAGVPGGEIQGVVARGRAELLADSPARHALVERFLAKYHPRLERIWGGRAMPPNRVVFRIVPASVRSWGL